MAFLKRVHICQVDRAGVLTDFCGWEKIKKVQWGARQKPPTTLRRNKPAFQVGRKTPGLCVAINNIAGFIDNIQANYRTAVQAVRGTGDSGVVGADRHLYSV